MFLLGIAPFAGLGAVGHPIVSAKLCRVHPGGSSLSNWEVSESLYSKTFLFTIRHAQIQAFKSFRQSTSFFR